MNTHSNSECYSQKDNKERTPKKDRINYVANQKSDKFQITDQLTIPVSFDSIACNALLDTGCKYNLLSESVFKKIAKDHILQTTKESLVTANGEEITILGNTKIKIKIRNRPEKEVQVYVCKDLDTSLILGHLFAKTNGVRIDFRKGVIDFGEEAEDSEKILFEEKDAEEDFINKVACQYIDVNL